MKRIIDMFDERDIERAEKYPEHCYVEVSAVIGTLNLGNIPTRDGEVIFDEVLEERLQDALDEEMVRWKNKQWSEPTITPKEIADSITSAHIYC